MRNRPFGKNQIYVAAAIGVALALLKKLEMWGRTSSSSGDGFLRGLGCNEIYVAGAVGFATTALMCGACYFLASLIAQLVMTSARRIPFMRMELMFCAVVGCLFVYLPLRPAHAGNLADPGFRYAVAKDHASANGAMTILAWFLVSVIECFRTMSKKGPMPLAGG